MPTYLCHGFRWERRNIRVFVIVQNLDDASPEWIIPAKSSQCILQSFYSLFDFLPYCARGRRPPSRDADSDGDSRIFNDSNGTSNHRNRSRGRSQTQSSSQSRSPSIAKQAQPLPPLPTQSSSSTAPEDDFSAQSWSTIKLLEEYDPRDLTAVSRPYAYVADYAVRIDLSCSIADEIARYEQKQKTGWFNELRDELQHDGEIRWYVVVNGDEVRDWPDEDEHGDDDDDASPLEPQLSRPEYRPQHQYQQHQHHQSQVQYQSQYQYQPQLGRPTPTREQRQHHAQYIHQQRIFEGSDREQKQQLSIRTTNIQQKPPMVPDKNYLPPLPAAAAAAAAPAVPPLRPKMSLDTGGSGWGGRPKTPGGKTGGLRRLFGRSSSKVSAEYST
jgi:hypothetical protein